MGGLDFMVKFATVGLWVMLLIPIVVAVAFVGSAIYFKIENDRKKKRDAQSRKNRWNRGI